ncbi:hypothetical protein Syun_025928 [Stephania yunnanensis]|uniref:Uncharacterized protein n=1 Tax=Stephania yunnanensis TaxID=152371 RepID=A0AAP0EY28_9MAGN
MVGGGNRRDEGPLNVHSTNVFAALESLRRKKKSDKDHGSKSGRGSSKNQTKEQEKPQTFWAPTPLTVKSWADVDDDDDDYYATTAPPQPVWGSSKPQEVNKESSSPVEMSESEEDGLDEGDDEVEDEHEHETEAPVQTEPTIQKPAEASLVQKDTERQLSKKELKKKELAELDAVLAELGISQSENNGQNEEQAADLRLDTTEIQDLKLEESDMRLDVVDPRLNATNLRFDTGLVDVKEITNETDWAVTPLRLVACLCTSLVEMKDDNLRKTFVEKNSKLLETKFRNFLVKFSGKQENVSEEVHGDGEKKQNPAAESKTAKKKKKKEKSKEAKEQNQPDEAAVAEPTEEDTSILDVKERLKKVTSMKKKKSSKEIDAAARAAAIEAAARSAKLAAAKKKEKNHYNQQPMR